MLTKFADNILKQTLNDTQDVWATIAVSVMFGGIVAIIVYNVYEPVMKEYTFVVFNGLYLLGLIFNILMIYIYKEYKSDFLNEDNKSAIKIVLGFSILGYGVNWIFIPLFIFAMTLVFIVGIFKKGDKVLTALTNYFLNL